MSNVFLHFMSGHALLASQFFLSLWQRCHISIISTLHWGVFQVTEIKRKILDTSQLLLRVTVSALEVVSGVLENVSWLVSQDVAGELCQYVVESLGDWEGLEVAARHLLQISNFQIISLIFDIYIQLTMEAVHQCPHYQRKCHVEAPCCKIFYSCKLCHDELFQFKKGCQTERMEFEKVEKIKCLICQEVQIPSQTCSKCGIKFAEYTCIPCRLYESNPKKLDDIFHCDDCKMCRRGTKETVTHCFTCGYCVPNANENHKCISNNAQSNCPVCLQTLLYSTKGYISLKCGHLIHLKCQAMLTDLNCPSCGMAWHKMTEAEIAHIDKLIQQTKQALPAEVKEAKVNVLCNECLHKTMGAPFHYYGVKCEKCSTYNTKMI